MAEKFFQAGELRLAAEAMGSVSHAQIQGT